MIRNLREPSFRYLKDNDISRIIDYYQSTGMCANDIAYNFGTNKTILYKILRQNHIPTRLEIKTKKEKMNIRNIAKEVKGYLAGAIDGEGYIFIVFSKSTQNYICGVYIRNTDRRLLEVFAKYFGGNIYFLRRQKSNHKDSYSWQCAGFKAAELCKCILPYLVIKRRQAELLLEFSKTLKNNVKNNSKLPKCIENKRTKLINKIKILNKRGVDTKV